ncbi:MAG: hypothetical protein AAFV19_23965 [Pseudomonadota bacterium]
MDARAQILDVRSALRLCLCTLLTVQALLPGLSLAALPSGPLVQAVLCTDHGPVTVLIDLDTGEPADPGEPAQCGDCLACGALALAAPYSGRPNVPQSLTARAPLMAPSPAGPAAPPAYAAARGPPPSL